MNKQLFISFLSVFCFLFSGNLNAQDDLKTMTIAPLPYLVSGKVSPDHIDRILATVMNDFRKNPHFTLVDIDGTKVKGLQQTNAQELEDLGQKYGATHLFQIDFLGGDITHSAQSRPDPRTGQPVTIGTAKGIFKADIRIYHVATGAVVRSMLVKGEGQAQRSLPPGAAMAFNNDGLSPNTRYQSEAEQTREKRAFMRANQGLHRKVMDDAVTNLVADWKKTMRREFPLDMRVLSFAKGNARKVKRLYINAGRAAGFAKYEMLDVFIRKTYNVGGQTQTREVPLGTLRVTTVENDRTLCVVYLGRDKIKYHFDKGDVLYVKVQN